MKAEIVVVDQPKSVFVPFELRITIGSEDEARLWWHQINQAIRERTMAINACTPPKSFFGTLRAWQVLDAYMNDNNLLGV